MQHCWPGSRIFANRAETSGLAGGEHCETNLITICRSRDKSRFGQVNKLARPSRIEGIGPFHCEAGLADLGRIRWGDAGELRTNVVDDVEVAVRPVVIPQAQIGADCLRV